MSFELFIAKCQKMYNVFEEEVDPMEEDAKTCFIIKWVEQSDPKIFINELKYHITTNPSGTVSYTT